MESEDLLSMVVDQANNLHKINTRLHMKYVLSGDTEPVEQKFQKDAEEWARWRKIGVQ